MALVVACLTHESRRYKDIAEAMAAGIKRHGDRALLLPLSGPPVNADVAVMYGWKKRALFAAYSHFVYADLGYFNRETHYRLCVDGWGPQNYVRRGLPPDRLASFGVEPQPWKTSGRDIVIAGSSAKAAAEHGLGHMEWERRVARHLMQSGQPVVFRPKPKDRNARAIPGCAMDTRPLAETLASARALVTHHSNAAIDALVAGIPVHCEIGAAAAFSVPLDKIIQAPRLDGREQFLSDVAWLEWSLSEMRSGECWAHLRGMFC